MKPIIFIGLLLLCLLSGSCAPRQDFDTRLHSIVRPCLFSIANWESVVIPQEINQWIFSQPEEIDDEVRMVTEYFDTTERIRALRSEIEAANVGNSGSDLILLKAELSRLKEQKVTSEGTVEMILEKQIRETLSEQGIFNPITETRISFPPVNFKLEKPPYLLVISPRDRIETMREVTLQPSLTLEDKWDIEANVDRLGVSSLVVGLGGLGATYPTFVTNDASLQFTIEAATEEWLHQYLVLKPLGFLYLLDVTGLARNYEIATMNETLASMVSKEIGSVVYEKHYSAYESDAAQNQAEDSGFDFNEEMREIRKTVDMYLAQGEIEQAEEYMEQKRQYLDSKGYYIRKLNQAYFAFHGAYADRPAFVNPIGLELKELREQSNSLKEFLDIAAEMTSRQDLQDSIK